MAMSVTVTEYKLGTIKMIKYAWVSAADGTASGASDSQFNGKLLWVVTDPGSTAPTDNYDIELLDGNSIDVLAGAGANRHTTTTQYIAEASLGAVADSKLTLSITNAGDSKVGTMYVYIR